MKFTRGCSVAYWGCLLIALILPINGWSPANFPNPQTDPARCGRPGVAKSWVCDPDRILSSRSRDVVEGILKDIAGARDPFAQASDCGSGRRLNEGYQVAVALAKEIELPRAGQEPGAAAEAMAARLMDSWGVGEAGCNDGTVLLLSQRPRQVAIFAGAGVKDELDAKRIQAIISAMRPLLKAQRYDEAVEGAAVDIGIALAGGPAERGSVWGFVASIIFFSLFFCVLVTSCLQTWRRNRQVRACQGLLDKLKREQEVAAATSRFPAASCPVCLEDFRPPLPEQAQQQEPGWAPPGAGAAGGAAPSAPPLSAMEGGEEGGKGEAELRARLLGAAADRAAAPSSSSSAGARQQQQQGAAPCDGAGCKPLVLPCGHSFCEGCLGRWLKDNSTCPMCRAPVTGEDQQRAPPDHRSRASPWDPRNVETELLFRLGSLQRLYPAIITADLLAAWTHQVRSGASLDWPEIRSDLLSPEARSAHAAHGAFGASSDFGGGSSAGGTGASGAW